MSECGINLRVIKMEYHIPSIHIDLPKQNINKCHMDSRRSSVGRDSIVSCQKKKRPIPDVNIETLPPPEPKKLVEELLAEIYGCRSLPAGRLSALGDSEACTSTTSEPHYFIDEEELRHISILALSEMLTKMQSRCQQLGTALGRRLCARDLLKRRKKRLCSVITSVLMKIQFLRGEEADMRFSTSPRGGASGWAEWLRAMRLVARLPAGVPSEFRRKLWLTLAEQHLKVKGVDWTKVEKTCFSEWTNPDDTELGVQIVKDLHRTGCSLFCGSEGRENQAVLKRVLLAYARWNKAVGYCQGFNMLAALILEVMDRSESDSLKVMIYLIEAVLPEGYFANNLRGLSVDMAVFRDLLRLRLPRLSAHLDKLQKGAAEGSVYEPPLTNVFTMQWFLTLFCNCLPHDTVLRVWDLAFLEGDAVLLTTALAIWDTLQDRILKVESADEFYSVMGELARETLEAPPGSGEQLLAAAARLGPVPELPKLRDKHRYNIAPWAHTVQSAAKKGLRLFYSEDETDSSDDGDKLAITTAYGFQSNSGGRGRGALVAAGVFGHPDRERLALDISALKQQYERLRERQRQAHIILAAACARQTHVGSPGSQAPISMNHLLLGKNAIVSNRGRRLGPPQGAIPPSRVVKPPKNPSKPSTKTKSETLNWKDENTKKVISRRDSIKWKDIKETTQSEDADEEEPDNSGKQVSESEVNEILQTSMRARGKSESSSYSECSESSTSTSLCDEPNRMSDFDSEPASISDNIIGMLDNNTFDSSADGEGTENENIETNTECAAPVEGGKTTNSQFGAYVQEFEDLLDRTNNIDCDRGLVCILPEENTNIPKTIGDSAPSVNDSDDFQRYSSMEEKISSTDDEINVEKSPSFSKEKSDEPPSPPENIVESDENGVTPTNTVPKLDGNYDGNLYFKTFKTKSFDEMQNKEDDEVLVVSRIQNKEDDEVLVVSRIQNIELDTEDVKTTIQTPSSTIIPKESQFSSVLKSPVHTITDHSYFNEGFEENAPSLKTRDDDEIQTKVVEKCDDGKNETNFYEFVDSNRGEQLRSYLNEFKKADFTKKIEIPLKAEDTTDIFKTIQNASAIDECLSDDNDGQDVYDITKTTDKDDINIKTISSTEYHSTSCDRSISSSLSSISPILKCNPGFMEERTTFMSYKSPCRGDSDVASEFSEDEKPIVLKIDKYFEHSPEFFGARKSGTYISSDEEDDKYSSKKRTSAYASRRSKNSSPIKTEKKISDTINKDFKQYLEDSFEKSLCNSKQVINNEGKIKQTIDFSKTYESKKENLISPSLPLQSVVSLPSPDPMRHKRIASLDSPLSIKYLVKQESITPVESENTNLVLHGLVSNKNIDHVRINVLEKTKSEELPRNQNKSFSVLDDEIEAIRSPSGRRNSERALKIIQENSKILHRILINQVSKSSVRDTFKEETSEGSLGETSDDQEKNITAYGNKSMRYLTSPRSTSLDDQLLKTSDLSLQLKTDINTRPQILETEHLARSSVLTSELTSRDEITKFTKIDSEKRHSAVRPKSFESQVLFEEPSKIEPSFLATKNADFKTVKVSSFDENKTDMFGWENKGFEAKQRISSTLFREDLSPHKSTNPEVTSNYTDSTKNKYNLKFETGFIKSEKTDIQDSPRNTSSSKINEDIFSMNQDGKYTSKQDSAYHDESPVVDKNSSLTVVSETILDPIDFNTRELTELSKTENSTISGTFNLSPPYRFNYRSSDPSSLVDSSYKNLKIGDLHLTHVADSFSRVTEYSPIDSNCKPEGFKFETSQSSDICIISSSMSFSFDPSVEEQPSSKPGTFNSSDTLCQLTSLDQVSTPISPKAPPYSMGRDISGALQNDLSLELDKLKITSDELSYKQSSYSDTYSGCTASLRTPTSPMSSNDKNKPQKSPDKAYSPFPARSSTRQPKELGLRLGLYKDPIKSPPK